MSDEENVTMTPQEAATLRGAYNLMNKLYSDPEKGMDFKRMVKGAGFKVPELDTIEKVTKPYDEKITGLEKALKDLQDTYEGDKKKAKETDEEKEIRQSLEEVKKKYDFDDDGLKKVVARMQEKKNPDADSAAAWVKMQEPKPKLTTSSSFGHGKFKGNSLVDGKEDTWKKLSQSPDDYFNDVADDVINNPENSKEFGGQF